MPGAPGASGSSPEQGPHPLAVLAGYLADPVGVSHVYAWCRRVHPAFPEAAESLAAHRFLFVAGIMVPYQPDPLSFVRALERGGALFLDAASEPPRAGDLYWSRVPGERPELGLVAKAAGKGAGWFLATDARLEGPEFRPRRRQIAGDAETAPIRYWVRLVPG